VYEWKKKGGEQRKHEATSNKWRKCTQIQQHKITEKKVQGLKVRGQGSNLIFCSFSGGRWDDEQLSN
jgi:hypothetical protein